MNPLDLSVNRSLGVQIKNAIKDYPDGNYKMLEIEVDTNALSQMYYNQHLDNIGPAYCSSLEILENAIKSIKELDE